MKYYIFAGNSPNIRLYKKDAIYSGGLATEALSVFKQLTEDMTFVAKYNYAYLVLHLGMPTNSRRNSSILTTDIYSKTIPFIVLQKYVFMNKPVIMDIENSLSIITDGFREEFTINKYAAERFEKYYYALQNASILMRFDNEAEQDDLVIGDTRVIMKHRDDIDNKNYIFDISEPLWGYSPINDLERISVANL